VPATTPDNKPLAALIVAVAGEELVHVPPLVVLVQVAVEPTHRGVVPFIVCAVGAETLTVLVAVFIHPLIDTE